MEILRYVTDHHPVTVRQVADHFAATKGQVRTTLLNVMERLRKKKYLTRRKDGGVFQYAPSQPKADLLQTLVQHFVDTVLGGAVSPFVAYLVQRGDLSAQQRQHLQVLLRELENDAKEGQ